MNRCGHCGRFFSWRQENYDSYVPWGCANPEYPEPYDPVFVCERCSARMERSLLARFLEVGLGPGFSDYQHSRAERRARIQARAYWRLHGGRPAQHRRARQRWIQQQHEIACVCGWRDRHDRESCKPSRYLCAVEDGHRDTIKEPA